MSVRFHALCRLGECGGEGVPGHQRAQVKEGVWQPVRWHASDLAEDQRECTGDEQWLQNDPKHAERSLLIAHLQVAFEKGQEQFAVVPDVLQELAKPLLAIRGDQCDGFRHYFEIFSSCSRETST